MKENRRRKDLWTQETERGEEEITRNTSGNLGRRVSSVLAATWSMVSW